MPIINEFDEENPKNSRTVDTETGIYLRYLSENLHERVANFHIIDEETILNLHVFFSNTIDEEEKNNDCYYEICTLDFSGIPKRKGYVNEIRRLFEMHGIYYRRRENFEDLKQNVIVDFRPDVVAALKEWEKSNANR